MAKESIAHLDRLVSAVDTDVDMQSEDDKSPSDVLHGVHEPLVAFTGRQILIGPIAPGMRSTPEEGQPLGGGDVVAPFELLGEVEPNILDGFTYSGVELAV